MDWTLRPFNAVFFGTAAVFLILLVVSSLLLRGKSEKTRKTVLVAACLITFVGFFIYKYALSLDAEYDRLVADMDGFNWWGELPLHLCNVNMILIPIAVLTDCKPLKGFCFFVGPMCAAMALTMPTAGFDQYSILLPRMLGYYGTHFMVFVEAIALVTYGLFSPRFRDLPPTLAAIFLITFAVFLIDFAMRQTGLYARANYFFAMETEGNPLLGIFHRWIPYPFLYLLPCLAILAAYMGVLMGAFALGRRIRDHAREKKKAGR